MAGANCLWTFFTFKLTSHGHLLKINIADGKHLCSLLRFRVNVNLRISLGLFVWSEKKIMVQLVYAERRKEMRK